MLKPKEFMFVHVHSCKFGQHQRFDPIFSGVGVKETGIELVSKESKALAADVAGVTVGVCVFCITKSPGAARWAGYGTSAGLRLLTDNPAPLPTIPLEWINPQDAH